MTERPEWEGLMELPKGGNRERGNIKIQRNND